MSKQYRIIKVGTRQLAENKTDSFLLPKTVISHIDLMLRLNVDVSTAISNPVPVIKGLLREIDITLDGSDNRFNLDFIQLRHLNEAEYKQQPFAYMPLSTGNHDWILHGRISFEDVNAINPSETCLDTRGTSEAVLQITMGTVSSAVTINNASLNVHVGEYLNVDNKLLTRRLNASTHTLSVGENTIQLTYGDFAYKQLGIICYKDGAINRDFIKSIRVRKRANIIHNFDGEDRRYIQVLENRGQDGTMFIIPFETNGKHARALNVADTTEFVVEIDVQDTGAKEYKVDIIKDTLQIPKA